ncbi:MAG: dephospho-CoA kinase [Proteobacteria bacterium]|nr:dephospho-CoA kinase [Pseudomonadota bacterium]
MANSATFVVVLTGGIAAGKTAVSDLFAQRGVPVIDTDQIAHEIVEPGQPALKQIAEAFGQEFLGADGRLDRKKMRNAIFSSPQQKTRLEGILHPAIVAEADHRIAQIDAPWCILVVPLLTETSLLPRIDRVLVVDVEESAQIARVMARDKISQQQAQSILDAQTSRRQRLALADDVLDNSGSLEQLKTAVNELQRKYTILANSAKSSPCERSPSP